MARILVSVGEASGDRLAAPLVARLCGAGHAVSGTAGPACVAAGLVPVAPFEGLAGHGVSAAVRSIPAFGNALRRLKAAAARADLVLAVDFPELNRRLLGAARCRTAWLAPPQAWAWRPWRAQAVAHVDWVGCVLPHAAAWYQARGVRAEFVGHPLANAAPLPSGPMDTVALLPGSRAARVARLLPVFLEAAAQARAERPGLRFVWGRGRATPERLLGGPRPTWLSVAQGARAALRRAGTAWVGAGTATLDAALAGRPCVIAARLDPAAEWLARRLVHTPAVGLPNLVLGGPVFPERVLAACTPAAIAQAAGALLEAPDRWNLAVQGVRATLARDDWAGGVVTSLARLLPARPAPMLRDPP